jgi:mRNA interferase MazF
MVRVSSVRSIKSSGKPTSQILRPAGAPGEVLISDWQGAGLPKASLIKPVLATIEQRLIPRKLGALQGDDVQVLRSALRQVLG